MICLNIERLSFSFGTKKILSNVTFSLDEADKLGIIGVNGCGKSTLFKLILGELEADEGNVYISKNKSVGILRQNDAFCDFATDDGNATSLEVMIASFPELLAAEARLSELEILLKKDESNERTKESIIAEYTALNEKYIADGGLEFRGRCTSTLLRMGFDEDAINRPFSSLSGGQRTRLALCRELCREPDILLLDEPTNHLDTETLVWLEKFLIAYKKCVIVISHDRYFLDRVTNKTLAMENCEAKLYNGGYTKSMEQRRIDKEIAERHYKNQQREIARQEAYIAQQRAWNREKNIIAAESRQKMLDKMVKLERPKDAPKGIKMSFSSSISSGNEVLEARNLSFGYGNNIFLQEISFLVKRGDRLFIVGPNGCGKSTLIKLLIGRLHPTKGYVDIGYNVNLGYYDQENQNLSPTNTVIDELWNTYPTLTELNIRNALARFRFIGEDVFKSVSELSGGERARLTLAKLMLSDINLLVLDEPTNHLDIDSREALEAAISEFDGTVITVSHDRYLIDKLATRIIEILPSGVLDMQIASIGHGYEELTRERERRVGQASFENTASSKEVSNQKEIYLKNKQDAANARKAKARLERLQKEAEKLEAELEEIEEKMNGDAAYDYVLLSELDEKKTAIEERLLEIYEEI